MTASSTSPATSFADFLTALAGLPDGYSQGDYLGMRWGVTLERAAGGRRVKLYGEELGGNDHVSFNLYWAGGKPRLKPCEMPEEKVIKFVLGFRSAASDQASRSMSRPSTSSG